MPEIQHTHRLIDPDLLIKVLINRFANPQTSSFLADIVSVINDMPDAQWINLSDDLSSDAGPADERAYEECDISADDGEPAHGITRGGIVYEDYTDEDLYTDNEELYSMLDEDSDPDDYDPAYSRARYQRGHSKQTSVSNIRGDGSVSDSVSNRHNNDDDDDDGGVFSIDYDFLKEAYSL